MVRSSWNITTLTIFIYCVSYHTVNAITESYQQQQDSLSSIVIAGDNNDKDGSVHITYWVQMFYNFPWLINTSLLYVTGTISVILWCSGYAIDYLMDRQEDMAMELAKRKIQACSLYGATDA